LNNYCYENRKKNLYIMLMMMMWEQVFCLTDLYNLVTSIAVFKKGFTQFLKNVTLNGRIYVEFSPSQSPLMYRCRAGFQVLLKTVA
jgi:hypothetical protein